MDKSKCGVEEKGQRTRRGGDSYSPVSEFKDNSCCRGCSVIYRNKTWIEDKEENERLKADPKADKIICPACQRIHAGLPAGIVTLSCGNIEKARNDIFNILKNTASKSIGKNPLARIIDIQDKGEDIVVTTTDGRLAERLGRDVYRAQKGKLEYQWDGESMVRVKWER